MTDNKKLYAQLNLPLCQTPPLDLPKDKQRELAAALADLLWNAAVAEICPQSSQREMNHECESNRGSSETQGYRVYSTVNSDSGG
jgi:hypothetical protein